MSFKSIGTLAGTVLKQAEMAARGHDGAHKSGMGKEAGAVEAPASDAQGGVRRTAKPMEVGGFTASLPRIGKCERMANTPPVKATSPVAAMRSHLLTEWLRHAALANSP